MNYVAQAEIRNIELALVERLRGDRVRVPPYPAVIAKLQAVLANPRASAAEIAAVVASDTALAAAILRRARSAMISLGNAVPPSLEHAVVKVGADELLHFALVASVGAAATVAGPLVALRRDAWRRALLSARLCHALARRRGLAAGTAFIAGLLHDFGTVVVIATLEDISTLWRIAMLPEQAWCDLVNRYHVEFGMIVGARWALPEAVLDVIARHHQADDLASDDLVGLVALVDRLLDRLDRGSRRGLAALRDVAGFDETDFDDIQTALADTARQMTALESARALPPHGSAIAPLPDAPFDGWPIQATLTAGDEQLRVTAIWHDRFECRGRAPIRANWLIEMTLDAAPAPVELVANVRHCRLDAETGEYVATAFPYGLSGRALIGWHAIVEAVQQHEPR